MKRKICLYFAVLILGMYFVVTPQKTFAAELIFESISDRDDSNDTKLVEVRVDPNSKNLNAVEGTIKFQGSVSDNLSVEISTDESLLNIWPTPPQYFSDGKIVIFTGGVPNGFDKEGLLFRLLLTSPRLGDLVIFWTGGTAYLNDGKGTKETVYAKPFTLVYDDKDEQSIHDSTLSNMKGYYSIIIAILVTIILTASVYGYKKIFKI